MLIQKNLRRYAFAFALLGFLSAPVAAQDSQTLIKEMLNAAIAGNESVVLQLRSRIDLLPKPENGDRKLSRSLNESALKLLRAGDTTSALSDFERANAADKSDAEVLSNLGYALLRQKMPGPAKAAILDSIKLAPGRSAAWFNLGQALGELGDKADATAAFDIAYVFSSNKEKTREAIAKLATDPSSSLSIAASAKESLLHNGAMAADPKGGEPSL